MFDNRMNESLNKKGTMLKQYDTCSVLVKVLDGIVIEFLAT